MPLLRALLLSGSLLSVLETVVASARSLSPGALGKACRQKCGTRQKDEGAGWKRVHLPMKIKEEAGQCVLLDKLLQDG